MSLQRRDIVEAIVFLPAMAVLAAVIGAGMYAIIAYGGWALRAIYEFLRLVLSHSLALAIAVILAAFVVWITVPRVIGTIGSCLQK